LRNHTSRINRLDISSDEKSILSGGEDKTMRIWDKESAKEVWTYTHTAGIGNCLIDDKDN
jgi:WD40 repeat protein